MTGNKLEGLLGMCRRAGRLVIGFDAVVNLCRTERAVVMVATDISKRTLKELHFHLPRQTVYRMPLTKDQTAGALGLLKPTAVIATADEGFSKAMLCYVEEESHYDD